MKKVALVVGHRYGSQGAYGSAGYSEYRYYDELFLPALVSSLSHKDQVKIFHRQNRSGYTRNMKALHKEIDDWGADYAVSFHFDAADSRSANGHTVLYNERDRKSLLLAKMFDKSFDTKLRNKDRNLLGRYKGRGGGFLRRGKTVNVLLEPFFASHQKGFMPGTVGYEALLSAVGDVLAEIIGTHSSIKVSLDKPVVKYHLGRKSLKHLSSVGNLNYQSLIKDAIAITEQDFSVVENGRVVPYPQDGDSQKVLDAIVKAAQKAC